MPFQKKSPPIKLLLENNEYNVLVELLTINENTEKDYIKENARKLKEKLLKYSSPYETEDKRKKVRIGFFSNEASAIMAQLLIFVSKNNNLNIDTDYYSVLQKVKETYQVKEG